MITYIKLIASLVGVGALVAIGWTINGWRVERSALRSQVEMYKTAEQHCSDELQSANVSITELRGAVDSANTEIAVMQQRADELAQKLTEATVKNAQNQVEFQRRLEELKKTLPAEPVDAIREAARRLGAQP